MKNIPVFIPDNAILSKFNNICESLLTKRECIEDQNTYISQVRDLLLPKLISGELDVSEIDI